MMESSRGKAFLFNDNCGFDNREDSIVEKLYSWELPMQICSKELYLKIVHTALDGTFNFDLIISELRVAYKQFVNQL